MYQALYRKYRPQTFSDVAGQPHIVRTLKNQITEKRLSHAYLFTGSRGTGKTSCAKILAKAVNCLSPVDGDPCNNCEICRGINNESILDITEIDAASNNGVDNIRDLRENTAFTPASAKYRVYIIDEVHMLSAGAFNALLKTLEEPPPHVIFILATTEVHKLPATILSRCQRFDFHRITPDEIASRLLFVAQSEGFSLEPNAATLIGKLSDGALRDALSLLDICAGSGEAVTEQVVSAAAGLTGEQYLFDLSASVAKNDSASALDLVDELYSKSKDLQRLCTELISHFRDLMLIKTVKNPENLIVCSSDELTRLKEISAQFSLEEVLHAIEVFEDALEHMNRGSGRRAAMEMALIKLCNPSLDTSPTALLRRISSLEQGRAITASESVSTKTATDVSDRRNRPSAPTLEVPTQEKPPQNARTKPAPTPLRADDENQIAPENLFELSSWQEILSALAKSNPLLKAVLSGSNAYTNGDLLLIDVRNESFKDMIKTDPRHKNSLRDAAFQVTGKKFRLGPYTREVTEKATEIDPLDEIIKIAEEKGFDV